MAVEQLSAELEIQAGLGASFTRAFDKLDQRVNASSRKLRDIGKGIDFDGSPFRKVTRQIDRATRSWESSWTRGFTGFRSKFARATDTAVTYLKRKMGRASMAIGKQLEFQPTFNYRGPPRLTPQPPLSGGQEQARLSGAQEDGTRRVPAAGGFAIAGIRQLPAVFKDTNVQLMETQENMHGLQRQSKNYEALARYARSMDKAVSPWLQKIDSVNRELALQERRIDHLRIAQSRLNRAEQQFNEFRSRVAHIPRTAGIAALGAAATDGYALTRGAQQFANFDPVMRVFEAEGVAEHEIPLIREQVFRLAETTQFTDVEIADVLVGMKKDGQAVTAELIGVSDILKLAVAESRSLESAWAATRTLINATGTDLADAIKLQEHISNVPSVSALNMEQLQYIAAQSLSIYKGISAFQSADFLALSGALERIATGFREFSLTLADAAAGNLSAPRQQAFDLLGLNITDAEGKLKDAVRILQAFERAFSRPEFLNAQGQLIGDKVQPILARTFGREALPTVANLLFKSEQIAANIAAINTPGTLDRKASGMEVSIDAATNRLKRAISVLSQRFFEALDGDGNFTAMLDRMASKVQQLSARLTENRAAIEAGAKAFIRTAGEIVRGGVSIISKLFYYLRDRGPAIRAVLTDFWGDLKSVWTTLKPVVMGVLAGLRALVELISQLGAGHTKVLAWLTAASVGWYALKIPILAVNAAYNTVIGTLYTLRAAYAGMSSIQLPAPTLKPPTPISPNAPTPVVRGAKPPTVPTPKPPTPVVSGAEAKPSASPLVEGGKRLIGKVPNLLGLLNIGAMFPLIAKIGPAISAAFAGIVPILSGIGTKLLAIGPAILTALGTITAPVAAIIATVVAGVAGAVALIIANWDKVKRAFWSTVETVKLFGSTAWEILKFVGGSIVDFFRNIGPNVQGIVHTIGNFTISAFKAVGDFLIQTLGPVGQGIVTIFSGIFHVVDWAATKTWNVLKTVGIAVGGFFKSVFGGIVNGIKASVTGLKEKVGQFFDWITEMNEKVQGTLRKIRNFFRRKNEERLASAPQVAEMHRVAKAELKAQGIELDIDGFPKIPAQTVEYQLNATPIPGMETAQEVYLRAATPEAVKVEMPELPELKIETPEAPTLETPELKIETPEAPTLQTPELKIETPEAPTLQTPELKIETPEAVKVEMPAAPILQTELGQAARSFEASEVAIGRSLLPPDRMPAGAYSPSPTTVEYVDFASVDEIDKTLKAGFKSLLDVNDAILNEIKGIENAELHLSPQGGANTIVTLQPPVSPAADVVGHPAASRETITREVFETREVFQKQATIIHPPVSVPETPVVSLPEMESPVVSVPELESPVVSVPVMETPVVSLPEIESPVVSVPAIESPVVSVPELESPVVSVPAIESPVVSLPGVPPAPALEMPADLMDTTRADTARRPVGENSLINIESPVVSMPTPTVQVHVQEHPVAPLPTPTPAQRTEPPDMRGTGNAGGTVHMTNNITIHQQPGEDAEMLTARILRELERRQRTEAYQ